MCEGASKGARKRGQNDNPREKGSLGAGRIEGAGLFRPEGRTITLTGNGKPVSLLRCTIR